MSKTKTSDKTLTVGGASAGSTMGVAAIDMNSQQGKNVPTPLSSDAFANMGYVDTEVANSGDMKGPATSVVDNLITWDSTDGTQTKDSGIPITDVTGHVSTVGVPVAGNLSQFVSTTQIEDSGFPGAALSDSVFSSANIADENVVIGDGGAKNVKDSGVPLSEFAKVGGVPVATRIASWSNDEVIQDSGFGTSLLLDVENDGVFSNATIADGNLTIGDGGSKNIKDSGYTLNQNLRTTDSPTFDDLTITGSASISEESIKSEKLVNFNDEYKFAPDNQVPPYGTGGRNVTDNYLGTFSIQNGAVDIEIDDIGASHGSSNRFLVTRHFDRTPVVSVQSNGNYFSRYIIHFRALTQQNYELFFTDSAINASEITYRFKAWQQGAMIDTTNSNAANDTGISECTDTFCLYGTAYAQLCGGFARRPNIITTASFTAGLLAINDGAGIYLMVVNSFNSGDTIRLPAMTITNPDGLAFLIIMKDASVSPEKPLKITGNNESVGGLSEYFIEQYNQAVSFNGDRAAQDYHVVSNYLEGELGKEKLVSISQVYQTAGDRYLATDESSTVVLSDADAANPNFTCLIKNTTNNLDFTTKAVTITTQGGSKTINGETNPVRLTANSSFAELHSLADGSGFEIVNKSFSADPAFPTLASSNTGNQLFTAINSQFQIAFGTAVTSANGHVSLAADGTLTFNWSGCYFVNLILAAGREDNNGFADMFFYTTVNNVSMLPSENIRVQNSSNREPFSNTVVAPFNSGEAVRFYMGLTNNNGGVFNGPTDSGLFAASVGGTIPAATVIDSASASLIVVELS